MKAYLDTSLVVSAFTNEVATVRAREWLRRHQDGTFIASWWVRTEIVASVSAKLTGSVWDSSGAPKLIQAIDEFFDESVVVVGVGQEDFEKGASFSAKAPGLRAGDALHLAVASAHGATVATLDKGMVASARRLSLPVVLV